MFITYSQNFEDLMLWRALKNIENGFYIDVGACDPDYFSVTRAFYDRNWSGINIEPQIDYFNLLSNKRTRDINLPIAIGNKSETKIFFEIVDTGLSTVDKKIAETHQKNGFKVNEHPLQIKTLTEICEEYVKENIHFLKIDVEGSEKAVLEGMNFTKFRPWIVVVESTLPMTQVKTHQAWESILFSYDYKFVYFDGLNCFYIAAEQIDLGKHFDTPPNVFDSFINIDLLNSQEKNRQLEITLMEKQSEIEKLKKQISIINSKRFKILSPLQKLKNFYKGHFCKSNQSTK